VQVKRISFIATLHLLLVDADLILRWSFKDSFIPVKYYYYRHKDYVMFVFYSDSLSKSESFQSYES
jgi:hypothetical protein